MGGKINYIQFTVTQRGQTQIKKTGTNKKETLYMLLSTEVNKNWKLLAGQTYMYIT